MIIRHRLLLLPVLLSSIMLTVLPPLLASENNQSNAVIDELSGIILDRTLTFVGHDFHRHFSEYWRLNYPDNTDSLAIFERPSARWGSLIWVEYRSSEVARLFLQPSRSNVIDAAQSVAQQVQQTLLKRKIAEQFSDHFDLESDEF